jgi:hypothetical protein
MCASHRTPGAQESNSLKPHWVFKELSNGQAPSWTWTRRLSNGQTKNASQPFGEYGQAVMDAITNGFKPKDNTWSVIGITGITSEFNAEPKISLSIRKKASTAPRAAEPPNAAKPPTGS